MNSCWGQSILTICVTDILHAAATMKVQLFRSIFIILSEMSNTKLQPGHGKTEQVQHPPSPFTWTKKSFWRSYYWRWPSLLLAHIWQWPGEPADGLHFANIRSAAEVNSGIFLCIHIQEWRSLIVLHLSVAGLSGGLILAPNWFLSQILVPLCRLGTSMPSLRFQIDPILEATGGKAEKETQCLQRRESPESQTLE